MQLQHNSFLKQNALSWKPAASSAVVYYYMTSTGHVLITCAVTWKRKDTEPFCGRCITKLLHALNNITFYHPIN